MRLLDEMQREAKKLEAQDTGFRLAGESVLAITARTAARKLRAAIAAVEDHHRGVGDALTQSKEA